MQVTYLNCGVYTALICSVVGMSLLVWNILRIVDAATSAYSIKVSNGEDDDTAAAAAATTSAITSGSNVAAEMMTPMVPGLTIPFTSTYMLPLLAALLVTVGFHEYGHAIAAAHENVRIESVGIFAMAPFVCGAYVKLPMDIESLSPWSRLRIWSAGIWHNVLLCVILYLVAYTAVGDVCSYVLAAPLYRTGTGTVLTEVPSYSPFAGHLEAGSLIVGIRDLPVGSAGEWYDVVRDLHIESRQAAIAKLQKEEEAAGRDGRDGAPTSFAPTPSSLAVEVDKFDRYDNGHDKNDDVDTNRWDTSRDDVLADDREETLDVPDLDGSFHHEETMRRRRRLSATNMRRSPHSSSSSSTALSHDSSQKWGFCVDAAQMSARLRRKKDEGYDLGACCPVTEPFDAPSTEDETKDLSNHDVCFDMLLHGDNRSTSAFVAERRTCISASVVATESPSLCGTVGDCDDDNDSTGEARDWWCLHAVLADEERLVWIDVRPKGSQEVKRLMYSGQIGSLWYAASLGNFDFRYAAYLPEPISDAFQVLPLCMTRYLSFAFGISATLAIVNAVPAYFLDGQHIFLALACLIRQKMSRKGYSRGDYAIRMNCTKSSTLYKLLMQIGAASILLNFSLSFLSLMLSSLS
eukprot:g538.t1